MAERLAVVAHTGGRSGARRALAVMALLVAGHGLAVASQAAGPSATVREDRGLYSVSAEFSAPGSQDAVLATLTDYEHITRFMPAVKTSRVVGRRDGVVLVEQEAVASFMLFAKRIHLRLEVSEQPGAIHFTDRCGKSFDRYDGSWTISERDGRTVVVYQLTARPTFDVPGFLLKRLLKRDALQMIEHLQTEISARAARREATPTKDRNHAPAGQVNR